jgi:pimeloyl-ACP methyl ester carboxylesterase
MCGVIVLQLAAAHPGCVAAIVMVDPPLVFSPERRAVMEAMVAATEAGNDEPRSEWIKNMFLPTSDRRLMEEVMAVMLSAPPDVAASAVRGVLEFDSPAAAALCTVPALHLAASPPRMPPSIRDRLPNILDGCTVGAGHFNQLEVPDQVNAMIEAFLRHYV